MFIVLVYFSAVVLIYGLASVLLTGAFFADPWCHLMLLEGAVGFGVIAAAIAAVFAKDWSQRRRG